MSNVKLYYHLPMLSTKMPKSFIQIFFQKVYYVILTRLNDFGVKMDLSRGEKSL